VRVSRFFPLARSLSRRRRARLRRGLLTALVLVSLLLLGAGWVGLRGWQARDHLSNAAGLARELSSQVLSGDTAQARRTLAALQSQTAAARSGTGDPGWWLAAHTPLTGDTLSAVREIAVAIDDLARNAFPALLGLDFGTLLPRAGRVDFAALRQASPRLTEADAAVRDVRARISRVPSDGLLPQVRLAVTDLSREIDRLSALTSAARQGAALLPALLGAKGPRTYLLVFQNLAEVRATGGMFGAYAVLRVADGRASVINQGTSGQLSSFQRPVLPLDQDTRAIYGNLIGIYPADVNLTPNFPTAAVLYREMFRRRTGTTVDGVLATDPVALSYLLRAIGPVAVPKATPLVATTAVRTLLSDTYQKVESPKAQDNYFAASAKAVFDALLQRAVDARLVLPALDQAFAERRILFWTAHPDEQAAIVNTRVAGVLPEREDVPTVGVFLNDGSGAKLGYYLTHSAGLTVGGCRRDGRRELRLRVTLGSTAPRSGLTSSVLGLGLSGDPYTARTLVHIFSPAAGSVVDAHLDGVGIGIGGGTERRRRVAIATVDIPAGRSRVLDVTLLTPVTRSGLAELWLTPGVSPWTTQISTAPTCEK
jgi:hypothetical protein